MFTNKKLKEENVKLKAELKEKNDALAALKHSEFKKYENMAMTDFVKKFENNDVTFGEVMYFAVFVLPVTTKAQMLCEALYHHEKDSRE